MKTKLRIAIIGIGGVGGYIGGRLAATYSGSEKAEVIFITRGNHGKAISENGLHLFTEGIKETVRPDLLSDSPERIGKVDLVVCCVKSYDFVEVLKKYAGCIEPSTIVLPFLNGVGHENTILRVLPYSRAWKGCIYINARVIGAGKIEVLRGVSELYFGAENEPKQELQHIEQLFTGSGIEARLSDDIDRVLWKKFAFIAPVSSVSSARNISLGELSENEEHRSVLRELTREVIGLAAIKGVVLPPTIFEDTLKIIGSFPHQATSSMVRDFRAGKRSELDALAGQVVESGKELNYKTPAFQKIYNDIKSRWNISETTAA